MKRSEQFTGSLIQRLEQVEAVIATAREALLQDWEYIATLEKENAALREAIGRNP